MEGVSVLDWAGDSMSHIIQTPPISHVDSSFSLLINLHLIFSILYHGDAQTIPRPYRVPRELSQRRCIRRPGLRNCSMRIPALWI